MNTTPGPDAASAVDAPQRRSQASSVAWAVTTMVIALVAGFLIWSWMNRDADQPAALGDEPGTGPMTTQEPTAAPEDTRSGEPDNSDQAAAEPDATAGAPEQPEPEAAPTMTPEQEEFVLGLQRRDADDPLAIGAVDAPVVIIKYADYRCPYCARWARDVKPELMSLIDDGTVRLEYRDTILFGEESEIAALAARAAGEQGMYWEYHDAIAAAAPQSGHADFSHEAAMALAEQIGVPDLELFEADLDSEQLREAMQADQQEAMSIGVSSTPTFLVNTTVVVGARDADIFREVIALEADRDHP